MTDFTWKIGGEAGFGIMTTGLSFARIAARLGFDVFDYVEYPSLIRGGHNAYEVRVSDQAEYALKKTIDYLVCLNEDTFKLHKSRLTPSSYVIYDPEEFVINENFAKVTVPFKKILEQFKGPVIMKNTIALGASIALLGGDLNILNQVLSDEFNDKGEEIIKFNQQFAQAGYSQVKNNFANLAKPLLAQKVKDAALVMTGNDAFSLGSVIADCRLYAAYPMTPASSVLSTLAFWQNKTGMIVRHSEDEIAVINTALGASFAGVRAACGTSGGGFALMVESISLAGVTEIPLVLFLSQRPGPATGMPTWTEQGDLLFAINAGHGEFPKIVLAPGDIEEMIELTGQSFNLADIYQTPVIVMSDMYLSESHRSLNKNFLTEFVNHYQINRGKTISQPTNNYLRYQATDDGISERLIPGAKGYFYQANSYEHLEDGHTTEDGQERKKQVEKRDRKWQKYLKNDFKPPKVYGDLNSSEIVFVSWGSTKGVILSAQKILTKKGVKTSLIHFTHVYPMNKDLIKPMFSGGKRYVLVENNFYGQFGKLLQSEVGVEIKEKILKYDGRPFWPEEIVDRLKL